MNGTEGKNGGAVGSPRAETERVLLSIDRPKSYCAAGRMFAPMPVLEVRGVGELSFPVPKNQAEALSDRSASRSGETGRNGAEIGPEDARLGGEGWEKTLAGVLDAAAEGIGCPRKDLGAQLRKLSALGPGESLRVGDPEAEETAGVLIVALPVSGGAEGGEIVVRYKDEETVLDIRVREPSEIAWAAFYADCGQKTRPVTAGRALALVFDLELSGGPNGRGRAPDYGEETERMARALAAWNARADEGEKMVVLLNYDYGERGFSLGELRGVDATVAEVLLEAAAGRRPGSFSVSAEGPVSFSEAGNASRSLLTSPRPPRSLSFSASGLSSLCLARRRLPDGRDRFSARTNCSPCFPAGQSSEEPWFRKHVFYARRLSRSRQALCRALSITTCNRRP